MLYVDHRRQRMPCARALTALPANQFCRPGRWLDMEPDRHEGRRIAQIPEVVGIWPDIQNMPAVEALPLARR